MEHFRRGKQANWWSIEIASLLFCVPLEEFMVAEVLMLVAGLRHSHVISINIIVSQGIF